MITIVSTLQGDVAVLDPGNVDQVIDEPRHLPQLSLQSGERPCRGRLLCTGDFRHCVAIDIGASGLRSSRAMVARNS